MSGTTSIETLAKADWDALEQDVVLRIRLLKGMCEQMFQDATSERMPTLDKMANELVLPNVRLLSEFCINVSLEDEDDES